MDEVEVLWTGREKSSVGVVRARATKVEMRRREKNSRA